MTVRLGRGNGAYLKWEGANSHLIKEGTMGELPLPLLVVADCPFLIRMAIQWGRREMIS